MKLDKIKFGMLVGLIASEYKYIHNDFVQALDDLIDIETPEEQAVYPSAADISQLMFLMHEGQRKIEAIKYHRKLTGWGLKESKDEVEKYWGNEKRKTYAVSDMMAKVKELPLQQLDEAIIINFINRFD